ncbi:MAG: hypothetical protein A2Y42_01370 [Omnitrophica WOR_2 bacterium GWB2_45_9]|nr:MAG: hypothetical protein A2Y42_01370 [Omnitrophica WOR_2 bacterium GWB2_45_9]OGX48568.1 MAG: hypothetical protein A2216_04815 [Omnitrophica WOR_2 bacterium RIFOXYA2_FULL_45_12]OGX53855.1 MAG: hypothetical protein A2321_00660 [Omnitrophica WOR_2 bacterium RIFOXYB2_FULL_45_11]OGX61494.1 MAG: hypothetical protein A2471_06255 [Omnitrophica WOR_2 bacterium RIFOXYC2_FULL_45_15]HBU08033.1 DUF58 domain-containing protein [Candidatus Omnitrophota bacterium]
MIPKEVLKNIRRIQITTSRMVNDVFAGQYQSVFKGRGMEFEEVREYQPGDEIRSIDWNVTARTGHPYIKKFVEERELTVMLVLDMSASCFFGTAKQLKRQLAAEFCSVLAFSAIRNNDRVGFIAFTDRIEKFIPPRKGLRHVLRVIREALYFKPEGQGTDINIALEYLNKVSRRKTITFVVSDFYSGDFKKMLSVSNKRHDIIAVTVTDPWELSLPDVGIISLEDSETGESFMLDTSDSRLRREYALNSQKRFKERNKFFQSGGVDTIDIRTDIPYAKSLFKFFRAREKRRLFR